MDGAGGDGVLHTLQLLEWRLKQLEFVFSGGASELEAEKGQQSITKRIAKIEEGFSKLIAKSPAMAEMVALQTRHPDIFEDATPPATNEQREEVDAPTKLSVVLTEAPSFPATASQLTQLNDLALPPTQAFTNLIAGLPRLAAIEQQQAEQAAEMDALRKRSALLLHRWHEVFVLGQGRCWAEWDWRMKRAERSVRREEVRRGDGNSGNAD